MVATDVASRGIGMIEKPPPSPLPTLLNVLCYMFYHCRRVI